MIDEIDFEKRAVAINDFINGVHPQLARLCNACHVSGQAADQVRFTAACILVAVVACESEADMDKALEMAATIIRDTMQQTKAAQEAT